MLSEQERQEIETELAALPLQTGRRHRRTHDRATPPRLGLGRVRSRTSPPSLVQLSTELDGARDLLPPDFQWASRPTRGTRLRQRQLLDAGRRAAPGEMADRRGSGRARRAGTAASRCCRMVCLGAATSAGMMVDDELCTEI